jgi:signal transduction histidine kinase
MGNGSNHARSWAGMPHKPALAFVVALVALSAMVALTLFSGARDDAASGSVNRSLVLLHRLFAVSAHVEEASALDLQRQMFGSHVDERIERAVQSARDELDALGPLFDGAERAELEELRTEVEGVLAQLSGTVGVRLTPARDLLALERIRARIGNLLDRQQTRLAMRELQAEHASHLSDLVVIAGAAVLLAVLLFAANTSREEFRWRERVERLEERLVGIVTHDLRSPLAAILAEARFLQRQPRPVGPQAARIARSAVRINRLTSVIAAFVGSHLEGGLLLDRGPCDLRDVLDRTLQEIPTHDRRVELECRGDCAGEWDRTLLSQLVSDLVDNAVRHGSPEAPVRVRAHALRRSVALEVQNAGQIPSRELASLFDAREREAATVRFSGGLGLFIVDAIARAHGGTVSVSSTAEEGTTFRVLLPRTPSPRRRPSSSLRSWSGHRQPSATMPQA